MHILFFIPLSAGIFVNINMYMHAIAESIREEKEYYEENYCNDPCRCYGSFHDSLRCSRHSSHDGCQ